MIVQSGREIKTEEIEQIQESVKTFSGLSRNELAQTICEHLCWHTASGTNKQEACLKLLELLDNRGVIRLPEKRKISRKKSKGPVISIKTAPQRKVVGKLSDIGTVELKVLKDAREVALLNEYMYRYHYLSYKQPFGYHLRYFIQSSRGILGCLLFSGAAKGLKTRDNWIGWSENERLTNLGFVVNNTRFLIFPWVKVRNLASHVLGKVVRKIGNDWLDRWGFRPVLMETFVDSQYFEGTCYRAANFQYLGMTTGMGLTREGKRYRTSPKMIFAHPLVNNFRSILCSKDTIRRVAL